MICFNSVWISQQDLKKLSLSFQEMHFGDLAPSAVLLRRYIKLLRSVFCSFYLNFLQFLTQFSAVNRLFFHSSSLSFLQCLTRFLEFFTQFLQFLTQFSPVSHSVFRFLTHLQKFLTQFSAVSHSAFAVSHSDFCSVSLSLMQFLTQL